ncbi:phosphotransferase [Anaeromyxobacter sp. SG17]|uniref:phosphotransferase n=1 Tax=Anaeromyxobacter sp. SG17 TaxID=2925405 RepID=UPI001F55BFCF|nr:phosphotransferase [Anaeromyxobacter sp. SG17]
MAEIPEGLRELAATLFPGAALEAVEPLAADAAGGEAEKAIGYGEPLRVTVRLPDGARRRFVFRTQRADAFGHDRRADRLEGALLSHELFNALPAHVRALDVGVAKADGRFLSLSGTGEPYLVTDFAEGALYAEDLRRLARGGAALPLDLARADALADYLAALHGEKLDDPIAWRRAVRDLVGHGEGIFGMVDGYPPAVPAAPPERLRAIEERCLAWRWRLRERPARLARTHGDFHPFNIVFRPPGAGEDGSGFALLDASRGGKGDPADDVVALAVNYPFFALDHPGAWRALGLLWRRFWGRYLGASGDAAVLESAPPYLAWRALVLASPRFYPRLTAASRDALLGLAERALDAGRLDLDAPAALFPEDGA